MTKNYINGQIFNSKKVELKNNKLVKTNYYNIIIGGVHFISAPNQPKKDFINEVYNKGWFDIN